MKLLSGRQGLHIQADMAGRLHVHHLDDLRGDHAVLMAIGMVAAGLTRLEDIGQTAALVMIGAIERL